MFNENFSFATADPVVANADCSSTDISPYNSRCSSPGLLDTSYGPKSHPALRRDTRFDTWRPPRHPSVTALTTQLEHHAIDDQIQPDSPSPMMSPTSSSSDNDEGFYDGPETPSTSSDESADFDPSLWDLSMFDYSATSSPRPSLSLEAQALSSYTMRRRQRQALVRLQCLAKRTPDIAMLIEECHPSSLPLSNEAPWNGGITSRSNSTVSLGGYKIEKQRTESIARKPHKVRKRIAK